MDINPYSPPSTSVAAKPASQAAVCDQMDQPRRGSQIVGTVVFAGAFLILGDVVLQPLFDAIAPSRFVGGMRFVNAGMVTGVAIGIFIGLKVCRCLEPPPAG